MQIYKNHEYIQINAEYGQYLTNKSATEDKQRVIVKSVNIPLEDSTNDWEEITQDEVDRIRKAKGQIPEVEIPEKLTLASDFATLMINKVELTNEESLLFKELYPTWESFINKSLKTGMKAVYNDKLYKVRQDIGTVLENQYPSVDTLALYEEINEEESGGHAGTYEDPIPYNNMMELFNGKYYSQDGVIYKCTRNSEIAMSHDLSALVGLYVEVATE